MNKQIYGTVLAEKHRQECNNLTEAQRKRYTAAAMRLIYSEDKPVLNEGDIKIMGNMLKFAHKEIERLQDALKEIASNFTQKDIDKIKEWEGEGTAAFQDRDYLRATYIKPLCNIATAALAHEHPSRATEIFTTKE